MHVLLRKDWADIRMEEVAQEAGVSLATFYNYYPTKQRLGNWLFTEMLTEPAMRTLDKPLRLENLMEYLRKVARTVQHYPLVALDWLAEERLQSKYRDDQDPLHPLMMPVYVHLVNTFDKRDAKEKAEAANGEMQDIATFCFLGMISMVLFWASAEKPSMIGEWTFVQIMTLGRTL